MGPLPGCSETGATSSKSREVGTGEDGLGIRQALELVRARSLPEIVIRDQEITTGVKLKDVLLHVTQLRLLRGLLLLGLLHLHVHVRLGTFLVRDALDVLRTRSLRIRHKTLVILLGRLFVVPRLRHVALQLLHEHVHEPDDAVALAVLLLVRTPRLRRRRRSSLANVGAELHKHRLRGARDHHRRFRRDHVRAAGRGEDLLLVSQLLLRSLLVQVRAVELVQAVLRLLNKLQRSVVLRLELEEVTVLLLALLRGFRHSLVQRLDVLLQSRDLLGSLLAGRGGLLDKGLAGRDSALGVRLLGLLGSQVLVAEGLLRVIVLLLLLEDEDHAVNHRNHLGEVHLLRLEAKLNQLQLLLVRRVLLHEGRQNVASARGDRHSRLLLQEAELVRLLRQGERLLEEVQSVVVVQDLNGLADGRNLLGADLAALVPFVLLRRALRRQVREERLRVTQLRRRVLDIVRSRHDGDGKPTGALRLRLDRLPSRSDLRLLRRGQLPEALCGLLLGRHGAAEVLVHLVLHGLQDADDVAALRGIVPERVLLPAEERHHRAALVVVDARRSLHNLDKTPSRAPLQERLAHALLESRNRTGHRVEVALLIRRELHVLLVLLLTDLRSLSQVRLRAFTVLLVLHQLLIELCLLGLLSLELALELRDTLRSLLSRLRHTVGIAIAVAHELVVETLLLLALRLDLFLHVLQQGHNLADRIRLRLQSESCAAPTAEEERGHTHHRLHAAAQTLEP